MSIAETKAEIVAALAGVDGVTAYADKPNVLAPGDAFVRFRGWARAAGQAFDSTYAVIVVLPQLSEADADAWVYEHADLLTDALRPVLYVESIEPSLLPAESKSLFTLTITGRTE